MFDCILYSKRTFFSMIGELLVFVYVLKYYVSFVDELCKSVIFYSRFLYVLNFKSLKS